MQNAPDLPALLRKFKEYNPNQDTSLIEKAYHFAEKAHEKQKRESGEPYFTHCCHVANILMDFNLDADTICAGLLHDTVEDTSITLDDLRREFNPEIAHMVQGVTKISDLKFSSTDEETVENWRKMLIAVAEDVRVILIKLADRTHNMRTLDFMPPDRQQFKAYETISLYAPLAQRLGMFTIKTDLEDLSFKYLHPLEYADIKAQVEARTADRQAALEAFKKQLEPALKADNLDFRILARAKNYYSIYRKMQKHHCTFAEIQDSLGVRIITKTLQDCYRALGLVHSVFKPIAGTFTDYIATPKANMYQSIHTTVLSPTGDIIELQIRTEEMHRTCEYGIAAHWRYKMGNVKPDKNFDEKINWIRRWIEWQQDLTAPREFLEGFKTDVNLQQIFVFTPRADVKSLPEGSTPIDFAYAIHTDIGDHYVGAKVNNRMVRMDYAFKTGDVCEIITRKNGAPKRDWLEFAKTAGARSHIKRYLRSKGVEL
ncbi:RelA/SpoT family protein [Candidatus Avelusimicrobium fimicolum]|jgi:guanosine-3',5'-bis(diphosphate) 3'-pyrophosphohydrolase|uniref:RelA/SpoT family protein n=1 Tax=Candidatus Avelusimicrobium fimicolum TaxID=3416216 RepID=UPI003CB94521|nr:bifunctional (p)ppGpp synthetase/guanosine-3',5'-bis(diphosphate) 3'-pyrophosphohydrolase [Spirochaetia bacterium]